MCEECKPTIEQFRWFWRISCFWETFSKNHYFRYIKKFKSGFTQWQFVFFCKKSLINVIIHKIMWVSYYCIYENFVSRRTFRIHYEIKHLFLEYFSMFITYFVHDYYTISQTFVSVEIPSCKLLNFCLF
jgi:hypothetical protein